MTGSSSSSDSGANRLPDLAHLQIDGTRDSPGTIADLARIAGADDAPLLHAVPAAVVAVMRGKFWAPTPFQVTIAGTSITCVAAARRHRVPRNEIIPIWIALQDTVRDAVTEPVNASRLITSTALPQEILAVHWEQDGRGVFLHRPGISRATLRMARGRVDRTVRGVGLHSHSERL